MLSRIIVKLFALMGLLLLMSHFQCTYPEPRDVAPPNVYFVHPTDGQVVSGVVPIVIGVNDNDDIDHVVVYVDGVRAFETLKAPYEFTWNTDTLVPNKLHVLGAFAVDKSGNAGYATSISVRIQSSPPPDSIGPNITIVYPVSGSEVSDTVHVLPNFDDENQVDKVEYYVDGYLQYTATAPPFDFTWIVSSYINGSTHTIFARAYDKSGNMGYSNVVSVTIRSDIIVDTTPPTVSILHPINGSTVADTVQILAEVHDNVGIQRVELYVDGQKISTCTSPPWKFEWVVTNLINGSQHSIFLYAYDTNQNQGASSVIRVTIASSNINDNIPPEIFISYPPSGATISGTTTIVANATDNIGVTNVEFYIDGLLVGNDATAPYEYVWDTSSLQPGSAHTIFAIAYDGAGNSTQTGMQNVTIAPEDLTAPTVSFIYPNSGQTLTENTTISVEAQDNIGVTKVEFFIDGALVHTDNTPPYTYDWDITGYTNNSTHTLFAKGYDAAGNIGLSPVITVTIVNTDITPPVVTILYPISGNTYTTGDIINVVADVVDNVGVDSVQFYIDGVLKSTDDTPPYSYNWDTSNYGGGGSHSVYVKGYDTSGNVGSALVSVTISP